MIFHNPQQLDGAYDHIYLAPHLDDASLSCGGAIAGQVARGERVLVVTFCTAAPKPEGPFSDLAIAFHEEWGLSPEQAVAARLREDQASMASLGVDCLLAGMLDAIYRYPEAYNRRETLFGTPAAGDPLLPAVSAYVADLHARFPAAQFYAPLGVGSHVDHLLTLRAATETLDANLSLYEDFPYVARPGALQQRLAELDFAVQPRVIPIEATLARKIEAIHAYESQLAELAHNQLNRPVAASEAADLFAEVVTDYARKVGDGSAAERLWLREV